jgi:hypothetical protein
MYSTAAAAAAAIYSQFRQQKQLEQMISQHHCINPLMHAW